MKEIQSLDCSINFNNFCFSVTNGRQPTFFSGRGAGGLTLRRLEGTIHLHRRAVAVLLRSKVFTDTAHLGTDTADLGSVVGSLGVVAMSETSGTGDGASRYLGGGSHLDAAGHKDQSEQAKTSLVHHHC